MGEDPMNAETIAHPAFGVAPPSRPSASGTRAGTEAAGKASAAPPAVSYEALFLEQLDFIERTVASIGRRNALKPWDIEDFGGQVKLRLISDDYAILRKFEGKSRLTTFLTTVIQNLFRDFRIQRWGKWRPSAAAKRLGDLGIQLEALLYRDGFGCAEAFEILRGRLDVSVSDSELESMTAELRARTTRRLESDAALVRLQASERGDQAVIDRERASAMERAEGSLRRVLASLDSEDLLILKMRFADSVTIRAIASTLGVRQRQMYTRVQRLLTGLRHRIEEEGVRCEEVLDLLDWPACNLDAGLRDRR